jgi:hypothetical protein
MTITHKSLKTLLFVVPMVSILSILTAQTVPRNAAAVRESERFETAANKWMLDPVDIKAQKDTAEPANRIQRDIYWDRCCGQATPLSQPPRFFSVNSDEGLRGRAEPEFPQIKNGVWLIGKFEGYHTFLSRSNRSVYTEMNIRVHHVFGQPSVKLDQGDIVDLGMYGGSILAPWGGIYTYQVEPKSEFFRPGHTYLLLLRHVENGDFYLRAKRWDLTSGRVQSEEAELHRAKQGKSQIHGLDVASMT